MMHLQYAAISLFIDKLKKKFRTGQKYSRDGGTNELIRTANWR
jgi:hypothetical protein